MDTDIKKDRLNTGTPKSGLTRHDRSLIIIYYRFFKSQAVFGNFFDWQIPARSDPSDLSDRSDIKMLPITAYYAVITTMGFVPQISRMP